MEVSQEWFDGLREGSLVRYSRTGQHSSLDEVWIVTRRTATRVWCHPQEQLERALPFNARGYRVGADRSDSQRIRPATDAWASRQPHYQKIRQRLRDLKQFSLMDIERRLHVLPAEQLDQAAKHLEALWVCFYLGENQ